jgi:hypothetical protein
MEGLRHTDVKNANMIIYHHPFNDELVSLGTL